MPLVSGVCSPLSPRYAASEMRPASLMTRRKDYESESSSSSDSDSSSSSSVSSHKSHFKKSKPETRSSKMKFLKRLAKVKEGGFESKNLKRFVKQDDVKTTFSQDGDIIVSGVKLEIPDYALDYKKKYDEELKKIRDLNCKEKEAISRWTRVSTVVTAVLTVLLAIGALIYIIYQAFFARSESI